LELCFSRLNSDQLGSDGQLCISFLSILDSDQFEDIWPKSARPSSYMEEIKSWRPYNLFPSWSNEEDTDDGLVIDDTDTVVSLFRHKIGGSNFQLQDYNPYILKIFEFIILHVKKKCFNSFSIAFSYNACR